MRQFFEAPERRFRVLWVSPELLANAVLDSRCQYVHEYVAENLPEGIRIEGVIYDPARDAFGFRLYHPSFDEVAPCERIPELFVMVRAVDRGERRGREFF